MYVTCVTVHDAGHHSTIEMEYNLMLLTEANERSKSLHWMSSECLMFSVVQSVVEEKAITLEVK